MRLIIEFKNKEVLFYKFKRKKLLNITTYSSIEAISQLKTINSKVGIYLVFNLSAEEIELLEIPQLYLWEKPAYKSRIEEKHSQHSAGFLRLIWTNPFAIKPSKTTRKDSVIKFFLPLNKSIEAVVNLIESRELNLLGIESYSYFLSNRLLRLVTKQLKLDASNPLLVLAQVNKTEFKLFFFNQGLLSFVRNICLVNNLDDSNVLLSELSESKSFVYDNFLPDSSKNLNRVLIAEDNILNCLDKTQDISFISSSKLAAKHKVKHLSESWLITSVINQTNRFFYKNTYSQKLGQVKQLAKAINLASLFIFIVFSFYLVNAFIANNSLNSVNSPSLQENLQVQNLKDRYLADLADEILAEDLIKSLEFTNKLVNKQQQIGMAAFPHQGLASVLSGNKNFKIKALKWQRKATLDDRVLKVELHLIQAGRGGLQELSSSLRSLIEELESNLEIEKLNVSSEVLMNKPNFNFNSSLQEADIPAVINFETYLPEV